MTVSALRSNRWSDTIEVMHMLKKTQGFTVVELLIVIVVIGILAAITIVSFQGIQGRARTVALKSDLTNTGKKMAVWMVEPDNSVPKLISLYNTYGGGYSAWIVGQSADNALTDELKWNDIPGLPALSASPGSTIEITARYASGIDVAEVNERMRTKNQLCIIGAAPGSTYDYRPMSGIHEDYDKMLYFDSAYGKVMTIQELASHYDAGDDVTCEGHVIRWKQATS